MKNDMVGAGEYALVTGATSGIGYELANIFAEHNYRLVIVWRSRTQLDQTARELEELYGVEVVPIEKDLFKRESHFDLYQEISARGIMIYILVNDASQGLYG